MYYFKAKETGVIYTTETIDKFFKSEAFERLTKAEGQELYRNQIAKEMRTILKPGDTVTCLLRKVSKSGMTRHIDFYSIKNQKRWLSSYIATLLDYRQASDGSLIVTGCGMDMGFSVVYELGYALWPKGTRKPHGTRNGEPDYDGGYALKSEWL